MWQNYTEEVVVPDEVITQQNDSVERKVQYKKVAVTDVAKVRVC